MSVDGQVLGVGTIAGTGAGAVSALANTGEPIIVGIIAASVMVIIAAFVARARQKA